MKILIVNAGSSSLKYQLGDMDGEKIMAKGLVERIGIAGSNLVHKYGVDCGSKKKYEQAIGIAILNPLGITSGFSSSPAIFDTHSYPQYIQITTQMLPPRQSICA